MVNLFKESETERHWHQAKEEAMGAGQSRNSASRRAHHLTGNASYQEKTGSLKTVPGQAVVHMERVKLAPSQLQVGPELTRE